jgi:vitamin B12 transporter
MNNSTPEGTPNLNSISLSQIDRIEIIKGPYSSLYGSGAIGGVIQVFTKTAKKGDDGFVVSTSLGSNNSKNYGISYNKLKDNFAFNFNFNKNSSDGINARIDDDIDKDLDGFRNTAKSFNLKYKINDNLDLSFKYIDNNNEEDYDDIKGFGDYYSNKKIIQNFSQKSFQIDYQYSKNLKQSFNYSDNLQTTETLTNGEKIALENDIFTKVKTREITLLNDININENSLLVLGYTNLKDNIVSKDKTLSSQDIFSQYQLNIDKNNQFVIGSRIVKHEKFNNHYTYNIGYKNKLTNNLELSIANGTAFKAPVVDQLYDTTYTKGNPNLEPEKSRSLEIGVNYNSIIGNLQANVYRTKISNDIQYVGATFPELGTYANVGNNVISKGLDLSITTKPILNWNITASYFHNNVKEDVENAKQLIRRPKETYKLTFNREFNKFTANIEFIKIGSYRDIVYPTEYQIDSYQLVNLYGNYKIAKDMDLIIKVNNAIDLDYTVIKGYNQPGRTLSLGIVYSF